MKTTSSYVAIIHCIEYSYNWATKKKTATYEIMSHALGVQHVNILRRYVMLVRNLLRLCVHVRTSVHPTVFEVGVLSKQLNIESCKQWAYRTIVTYKIPYFSMLYMWGRRKSAIFDYDHCFAIYQHQSKYGRKKLTIFVYTQCMSETGVPIRPTAVTLP